ncbi:MAG: single-stranded-DNA-specific exonuclease RecJ [Eubacterium sp.]|nr:single-stranded-DNA-specific exonuclease RecJ [Eubacterium sp.]
MKKWLLKSIDGNLSEGLRKETGLPSLVCDLLVARGIHTADKAGEYFNGDSGSLSDPYLIKDMDKAVAAIEEALENGDKITVYGDYDCDGITATVMLVSHIEALGGEVDWYIPQRDEGYGLNLHAIQKIADSGTGLIITVDNGISAVNEAELVYELGMKLVITDHHAVPEVMPRAEAVVDPHRHDDDCPCKYIAGCVVALKLIMALEHDTESVLEQYADLACIGTIGDVVPLVGENRIIVKAGLSEMEYSENSGLQALISAAGLHADAMTATAVAFGLCPRINAAGRYGEPSKAAELFLAQKRSIAAAHAEELCELNEQRKQCEAEILDEAVAQLTGDPRAFNERVLVVVGDGWKHGVIGIVSARLTERYGKPSIVIGIENGEARGSARSIDGFSIFGLLNSCKDVLTKYGGHEKAGGFSLEKDMVEEFRDKVRAYSAEHFPVMPVPVIEADKEPTVFDMDISAVENLKYLQPFGEENPAPLFLLKNCEIISTRPLKDGKYTSFQAQYCGRQFKFLCFSVAYADFPFHIGDRADVLANLEVNEYNDVKSVSIRVKELRRSGINQDKLFAAKDIYEKIINGEKVDGRLAGRIIPTTGDMKLPFDLARKYKNVDGAAEYALSMGMNYCKFMMCLHIFNEFGHLKLDRVNGTMEFIKGGRKIELEQSAVIKRIKKSCGMI